MNDEILYYTADGIAIYRGEPKPTERELSRAPESYKLGELDGQRLRELSAECAQGEF